MSKLQLKDLSQAMREIDICMMATNDENRGMEARPMSNNQDVEYDGHSYFFALEDSSVIRQLRKSPVICLSYEGHDNLYISIMGEAYINQKKDEMKDHWVKDLDVWFEDGIDTEGLAMIHVNAERIKYWQGEDNGEIMLS